MRRAVLIAVSVSMALLAFAAAAQTEWPARPVTIIVPYPPGGVNDVVGRAYADKLSAELGKPVLIDNRAGAGTTVASNYAAKLAPDGYTIYACTTSLIVNPTLTGGVAYDPHKSFALVSLMSVTPFILHVNSSFPAKNMAELVAAAKTSPGRFSIASSGIGAINHLTAELFKGQAGLDLIHVPYKGGAPAGQDLAAGQVHMMFSAALEAVPHLSSGRTRAIAITSAGRSSAFPDIPTVAESTGLKDFDIAFWQGMVVTAGTPAAIVDRLQKAIAKVAADPQMIERFKPQGVEIRSSTPAEFRNLLLRDEKRWSTLIRERNIRAE